MKIMVVHSRYNPRLPSGENIAVDMQVRALQDRGHDVALIDISSQEDVSTLNKIKIGLNVSTGFGPDPTRMTKGFRPDIIHVHNLFPNFGTRWTRTTQIPIIQTIHNYRYLCAQGSHFRNGKECVSCLQKTSLEAVKNACYRNSRIATLPLAISNRTPFAGRALTQNIHKFIFVSDTAKSWFLSNGLDAEKAITIPNFVDDQEVTPHEARAHNMVFAGRLSEQKGLARVLDNWPSNLELSVFGSGAEPRDFEAFNKRVSWFGNADSSAVIRATAESQCLIFPSLSREGGVALVYLQALASATPTIAIGNVSPVSLDIEAASSGIWITSFEELPSAIRDVNSSWKTMSRNAKSRFRTEYSKEVWVSRMEDLYATAISCFRN